MNLDKVYQQARQAAEECRKIPLPERLAYISALKKAILEDRESIIDTIQLETKKSRSDALMSEIFGVLDHLVYLEKYSHKVLQDRKVPTPLTLMGKSSKVFFEPMGISLIISPWNYPFYQAIVPCTLSFICGNATIYKPSEFTPLKGLVERLLEKAGFKPHWIQVVYGDGKIGQSLIELKPNKIFFTGSVATGKKIMTQAASHLIPVELELGGKDPSIIFEDANLKRAAAGVVWGALTNCGQSCTSVERILVQDSIYSSFRNALIDELSRVKQELDSNGDADMGLMTTAQQCRIIQDQLEDARGKGADITFFGKWDGLSDKIPPILLENLNSSMKVDQEESFGPLLPLYRFKDERQAVQMANDSNYGLSASVWTQDQNRAIQVARQIDTGNVSINNVMLTEGNHALPFGGTKQSGIGRYKGEFGFYCFSNIKSVLIDKNSSKIEANWYPYTEEKYQIFTRMMLGIFGSGVSNFIRFLLAGLKLESYSQKARRGIQQSQKIS